MPKVSNGSRTPLEEKMITALLFLDTLIGEGGYYHPKGIQKIIGGRWTKYRQAVLDGLVVKTWAKECTPLDAARGKYYAISEIGRRQIMNEYRLDEYDYITSDEYNIYIGDE